MNEQKICPAGGTSKKEAWDDLNSSPSFGLMDCYCDDLAKKKEWKNLY